MVKIIEINKDHFPDLQRSVCCIGYFDGMHKGHQKLINSAVRKARTKGILSSLICFSPDPVEVISRQKAIHLFSDQERYKIAEDLGIDQILIIRFDEEFMNLPPESFIEDYLQKMNIEELICGFDFSFGRYGKGDPVLLKQTAEFPVEIIEELRYEGKKISSTRIKEAVYEGNFELAERLLGFPYYFTFEVINCLKIEKEYVMECKNIDDSCIVPKDGFYGQELEVREGSFYLHESQMFDLLEHVKIVMS